MAGYYDSVVIGGGAAGLAAAAGLLSKNPSLKIVVLEARDRVGGRTLSVPMAQMMTAPSVNAKALEVGVRGAKAGEDAVDLGGQWFGPGQHRALRLASELGLALVKQPYFEDLWEQQVLATTGGVGDTIVPRALCSGTPLPGMEGDAGAPDPRLLEEVDAVMDLLDKMAHCVEDPMRISPRALEVFGTAALSWPRISVADWMTAQQALDTAAPTPTAKASALPALAPAACCGEVMAPLKPFSDWLVSELTTYVRVVLACEPAEVSLQFLLWYINCSGGVFQLADGEGTAQTWRIRGGSMQLSLGLAKRVAEAGGRILLGQPVQAVKAHVPRGGNALAPGGYVEVTTQSGLQLVARHVVVAMPPPVWKNVKFEPPVPPSLAVLAENMRMGCAVKCVLLYNKAWWAEPEVLIPKKNLINFGPAQNLYPAFYTCEGDERLAAAVGGAAELPALVALSTGDLAREFLRQDDEQRKATITKQLAGYFGSDEALHPIKFVSKEWVHEPWSQGCYTGVVRPTPDLAPEIMPTGGAAAGALVGLSANSRIHWAGTELAADWCGYIEGALQSGEAAAERVLNAMKVEELSNTAVYARL